LTSTSGTTQDITELEQTVTKNAQFNTCDYEHHTDNCHAVENTNVHTGSEILSTADLYHESSTTARALTTQALHEHDQNYVTSSVTPYFLHAGREEHAASLEVEDTDTFSNRNPFDNHVQSPLEYRHQIQNQDRSSVSMCEEAGFQTALCQGTCRWSRSCYTEHPERNEYDHECFCWNKDQSQELTASGIELAGVGEHLASYDYQGYSDRGELVVDYKLAS